MAGALIIATAATLRAALHDRRIVQKAKLNGLDLYLTKSDVRSEVFRLVKHVVCFSGICAITTWGTRWLAAIGVDSIQYRNGVLIAVAALLAVNSLWDLWSRHNSPHAPQSLKRDPGKSNP